MHRRGSWCSRPDLRCSLAAEPALVTEQRNQPRTAVALPRRAQRWSHRGGRPTTTLPPERLREEVLAQDADLDRHQRRREHGRRGGATPPSCVGPPSPSRPSRWFRAWWGIGTLEVDGRRALARLPRQPGLRAGELRADRPPRLGAPPRRRLRLPVRLEAGGVLARAPGAVPSSEGPALRARAPGRRRVLAPGIGGMHDVRSRS